MDEILIRSVVSKIIQNIHLQSITNCLFYGKNLHQNHKKFTDSAPFSLINIRLSDALTIPSFFF